MFPSLSNKKRHCNNNKKKKEKRNIFSFWTLSAPSTMLYLYLSIKQSNVAISE
jgi:hypothetical protein